MQWTTLMKKEMLQFWRNKQIIWVPLVMAILAVMDPITYYFLPEILELSGGLPEGAVFEIPELTANDSFLLGVESLNFMGVMLLLLISMGAIAAERKSGVAEMMYTKPIHPFSYMMSKWLALLIVAAVALFTALAFNWYYTNVLYGELAFFVMLKTWFLYGLADVHRRSRHLFQCFFKQTGIGLRLRGWRHFRHEFDRYIPWAQIDLLSQPIDEPLGRNALFAKSSGRIVYDGRGHFDHRLRFIGRLDSHFQK